MLEAPDQQLSLTDSAARSMNSRGSGVVGYNVQSAVRQSASSDHCTPGQQRRQRPRSAVADATGSQGRPRG
jgi:hypothetical protein